jgi:hypothetical protein
LDSVYTFFQQFAGAASCNLRAIQHYQLAFLAPNSVFGDIGLGDRAIAYSVAGLSAKGAGEGTSVLAIVLSCVSSGLLLEQWCELLCKCQSDSRSYGCNVLLFEAWCVW